MKIYKIFAVLVLFSLTSAYAQNPPADVGQNNIIWLEANDLTGPLADGFTWSDKTANGFNAIELGGGGVPTLQTIGGQQYLRFSGVANEQLRILDDNGTTNLLDNSSEFTVVTVFNTGATDTRAIISKRLNSGNRSWTMFYNTGFNMFGYAGSTTVGGSGSVASAGNPYISTMTVDAALSGASVKMFVNTGAAGSTGSNISIPDRTEDIYIGLFDAGDTRYFNGDIAEIIIYRDALNGGERLILENYLAQKYGITIGNDFFGNDPDFQSAYSSDIRGIGTANGVEKQSNSGFSSGLQLSELNTSLDAVNEFVMFGHNGSVSHADNDVSSLGEVEIINRWTKDYYIEFNQNGVVDDASVSAEFNFDFSEAGLAFSGSASDYVLLFRDSTNGNFTRVFANSYSLQSGDQIRVNVPASRLRTGYYTLGRGTQLISRTWYVLTNGNWSNSGIWTLDAGVIPIPNNPFNEVPGNEDNVIIRSGKTVTIQPATNNLVVASLTVDGSLNVGTSSGHNFNLIEGTGRITISGNTGVSNFPDGITTSANGFGDDANGGLLIVSGTGFEFDQNETFKDVRIELTNPTDIVSLGANLVLTGSLTVRNGTLQFGDGTTANRSLDVFGDVNVERDGGTQDGRIITASANARHEFNLYGDFTNEGFVAFTQRTSPDYVNEATNGIVDFNLLNDSKNQIISVDSLTYFYRIEVNKGSDATYIADLQASSSSFFNLVGPANDNLDDDIVSTDILNANANALGLISGTLKIGTNVNIPVLNRNGNYCIGSNGRLWIDGGTVTKNIATAIVPYGVLELSAGSLTATGNSGVTLRINGLLKVSGGTLNTNNIRTSVQGVQSLGGYQQSGGDVLVDGNLGSGSASPDYYIMSLTYPGNVFLVSGGTLTVRDANARGALFINSDPGNINVTGGTLFLISGNANPLRVTSKAPFYNVSMRTQTVGNANIVLEGGTSGVGGNAVTLPGQDLVVINDLIIEGFSDLFYNNPLGNVGTTFAAVTSAANVNDVYVGGSFFIGRNSIYQAVFGGTAPYDGLASQPTNVNTTYFNQTSATSVIDTVYWGVTVGQSEFGNFHLDRNTGSELRTIARTGNTGAIRFDINGNVDVQSGTLDQNAYTFRIWGSITNLDRLGTYYRSGSYPVAGGTPSIAQIRFREDPPLTFTTADNSIFGNIRFNVGAATIVEFNSDVKMERVEYWNGRIYVKNHTLTIDEIWNWNNGAASFFDGNLTNSYLDVTNTGFSSNIGVFTDGKASDGGLKVRVVANSVPEDLTSRVNNTSPMTFPVGFTLNGGTTVYNRPMQLKVNNFVDTGYVQVRVVSGELLTSDLAGGELLRHYWKVSHSDFTTLPIVALRGYFRNRTDGDIVDLEIGNSALATYVPGKVLDGGSYQRSYESNSVGQEDFGGVFASPDDGNTRVIVFNGNNVGTTDDDLLDFGVNSPGFTLENANYTTGVTTRFVGAPQIFYSRNASPTTWSNTSAWSLTRDGAAAGDYPQIGDIAVLTRDNGGPGDPNAYGAGVFTVNAATGPINVAEIVFNDSLTATNTNWISGCPRITFSTAGSFAAYNSQCGIVRVADSHIGGPVPNQSHGAVIQYDVNNLYTGTFPSGDFGDFNSYENALVIYAWSGANGTISLSQNAVEYPMLWFEGGNLNNRIIYFPDADVTVNGRANINGNMRIRPNNSATSRTLTFKNILEIGSGCCQTGYFEFDGNSGANQTVEVEGNLIYNVTNPGRIQIVNNSNTNIHKLIINSDLTISGAGLLNLGNGSNSNVELEIQGNSNNSYTSTAATTPNFYRIIMNKGLDQTNTFSFDDNFIIATIGASGVQPVEILNGTLIFNDPGIDITLANASTGNFFLPNINDSEASSGSGALEIQQGRVAIEGDNTGLILDGLLRVNGGTVDLATINGNGNNFIEYTSSGNSRIDVLSGVLNVGSQIRRNLTSTTGILDYSQSSGAVRVGVRAAPNSNRGVFEIINTGSSFTHTGGDLTIVRQNGSTTTASLIMKPDQFDIDVTGSTITIGDGSTPINQNNIGIDATVPLNNLVITGNSNLRAQLFINQFELQNLTIQNNGRFDANGLNLTINGDLFNDGILESNGNIGNGQTTFFPNSTAQQISGIGTTTFWNMDKTSTGTLTVSKDLTIENILNLESGVFNTNSSSINLKGDMIHDAFHQSAIAGPGIVFNGSELQNLGRSTGGESTFGTITIDNSSGVDIPVNGHDFTVQNKVILSTGRFNIGSNLLTLETIASFENGAGATGLGDFSSTNMLTVNTSIVDKGVRKIFDDSYTGTFLYPLGLTFYTPAEVEVDNIDASTPNTGFITIKPINGITGGITEDDDETCPDVATTDFVDQDNVLQYYWLIKSSNITDFDGAIALFHVDDYESIDAIAAPDYTLANYAPARLLDNTNTWDKNYSEVLFDEVSNRIDFKVDPVTNFTNLTSVDIQGRYTAGITRDNFDNPICGGAIPDVVPVYITIGTATTGSVNNLASFAVAPGGTVPSLGESPDLIVAGDFTLDLTDQFWRFRRVEIESGATLSVIGAGVNLGTVVGEGNIKLIDNSNFPAGDFDEFFPSFDCIGGGGVEYEVNSGSQTVLTGITNVRNVILSGSGEKVMAGGVEINICNNLEIRNNGTFSLNDNVTLRIKGDVLKNSGTYNGDFFNTEIILDGSVAQTIDGTFTGVSEINRLEIDNANSVTIVAPGNEDLRISEELKLTNGRIITDNVNTLTIKNGGIITGNFSNTTHVDGPLSMELAASTQNFLFPIGDQGIYLPIEVINPNYSSGPIRKIWTAEYISSNPQTSPLITNVNGNTNFSTYNGEVANANSRLSSKELWTVDVASPATSQVRIAWNTDSDVGADASDWQFLRVMGWDAGGLEWESYGNGNSAPDYGGFSVNSGSIVSDRLFNYSTNFITWGAINTAGEVNNALPVELISFEANTVDQSVVLNWSTSSEVDMNRYEVYRSTDLVNFDYIGEVEASGEENSSQDYFAIDESPNLGVNYYKLKMIDNNEEFEFSKIQAVHFNATDISGNSELTLFPNPVTENVLNYNISGMRNDVSVNNIKIHDLMGNLLLNKLQDSEYSFGKTGALEIPNSIVPGLYIFSVESELGIFKKKFILK